MTGDCCSSTGYVCSSVRGLSSTVMELRLGRMSVTQEYACDKEYFNDTTKTFTLVGRSRVERGEVSN